MDNARSRKIADRMRRGGIPFPPFLLSLADSGRLNLSSEIKKVVNAPSIEAAAIRCLWWFGDKMPEHDRVVAAQNLASQILRYYRMATEAHRRGYSKRARKC